MPAHKLNAVSGVGRRVASSGLPAIAMAACDFRAMTSRRWQAGEAGEHLSSSVTSQPEELSVVADPCESSGTSLTTLNSSDGKILKLPAHRAGVLPGGSASQPGKEDDHFSIASLDHAYKAALREAGRSRRCSWAVDLENIVMPSARRRWGKRA